MSEPADPTIGSGVSPAPDQSPDVTAMTDAHPAAGADTTGHEARGDAERTGPGGTHPGDVDGTASTEGHDEDRPTPRDGESSESDEGGPVAGDGAVIGDTDPGATELDAVGADLLDIDAVAAELDEIERLLEQLGG